VLHQQKQKDLRTAGLSAIFMDFNRQASVLCYLQERDILWQKVRLGPFLPHPQ
jgi:hypothetical protein